MSWTTPHTWVDGEALEENIMNEQIRDNFNFVFNRPNAAYTFNEVANFQTNQSNFQDVNPNTNLTIETGGDHVLATLRASITNTTLNTFVYFDIEMDGTLLGGDDGLIGFKVTPANNVINASFSILVESLSAAVHIFKLQWKTSGGLAIMYAGAGTANVDLHGQFWVHGH